jgi:hypothetical protein
MLYMIVSSIYMLQRCFTMVADIICFISHFHSPIVKARLSQDSGAYS